MSNNQGDWAKARRKINEGKNYKESANVALGDITVELSHRLLTESEYLQVRTDIDTEKLREHRSEGQSDAEERVLELQEQDELTEAEERELKEVSREVKEQQAGIMESLGYETYKAFMDAGKKALVPSDDDIQDAFNLDIDEQKSRFNFVPQTREDMAEALKLEMNEVVTDSPYLIKFTIGQQAFAESTRLLGNSQSETNEESQSE